MEIDKLYDIFRQYPTITTDTRHMARGALFFALHGENFDGNTFAHAALEAGCPYAIIDNIEKAGIPDERFIIVDNVLETLQSLAHLHRHTLGTKIIQITGTNGKTTTKELIAHVLMQRYRVHYTKGNLNNHIGVPLTLLALRPEHEIAVIETGANHPGEIRFLSSLVDADCGLVTNVGKAHLAGFGSFEGVVKTKKELFDYLASKRTGLAFVNTDDPYLMQMSSHLTTIGYGSNEHQHNSVLGRPQVGGPYLAFDWRATEGTWHCVQTKLVGMYNFANAMAAVAIGHYFHVPGGDISTALASYTPTNNRSEWLHTAHNELIVDAYNANPTSMQAALQSFAQIDHSSKIAILGEMRELGASDLSEHQHIAALLPSLHCQEVWLVGSSFAAVAPESAKTFADVESVIAHLAQHPISDHLILIKGSNGTQLFRLKDYL